MRSLGWIAASVVAAVVAGWSGASPLVVFVLTAAALVPISKLIGDASEDLAVHAGPRFGGVLTAAMANLPELLIGILALQAGLLQMVKASITGSIVANLLPVLGLSLFVGGLRHGRQYFNREQASMSATLMILTVIALVIPALYWMLVPDPDPSLRNAGEVERLSEAVAAAMLVVYALSVYFSLYWDEDGRLLAAVHRAEARWSLRHGLLRVAVAVASLLIVGRLFVETVPEVTRIGPLSEYFIGIVVIPVLGTAASHMVSVDNAFRNRADLSLSVAMGSSIHLALFVAPALVYLSLLVGHPMDLIFGQLDLVALAAASLVATLVAHDGQSNWLEGAMLMAVYAMLGLAFYWMPM